MTRGKTRGRMVSFTYCEKEVSSTMEKFGKKSHLSSLPSASLPFAPLSFLPIFLVCKHNNLEGKGREGKGGEVSFVCLGAKRRGGYDRELPCLFRRKRKGEEK